MVMVPPPDHEPASASNTFSLSASAGFAGSDLVSAGFSAGFSAGWAWASAVAAAKSRAATAQIFDVMVAFPCKHRRCRRSSLWSRSELAMQIRESAFELTPSGGAGLAAIIQIVGE